MNKAVFTHGEWKVVDGHYPSIIEIRCGERMRIPVVLSAANITYEQSLEREANAHLIAAAPEMYDVIVAMLEQFDAEETCHNEYDYIVIREAKKALAKARGEL